MGVGMSETPHENQATNRGKHTAIYCRVASAMCVDRFSVIEVQKAFVSSFAASRGYSDFVYYLDDGYTGITLNRPAFMQMTEDIRAGKIAAVIAHNLSRIGRNFTDVGEWLTWLAEQDVALITTDGFQNRDIAFPADDFKKVLRNFARFKRRQCAVCRD
jgi:DNA invertase Pin-like site-specific DNA recombinase